MAGQKNEEYTDKVVWGFLCMWEGGCICLGGFFLGGGEIVVICFVVFCFVFHWIVGEINIIA